MFEQRNGYSDILWGVLILVMTVIVTLIMVWLLPA